MKSRKEMFYLKEYWTKAFWLLKCFFTTITIKIMYLINDSKNTDIFAI